MVKSVQAAVIGSSMSSPANKLGKGRKKPSEQSVFLDTTYDKSNINDNTNKNTSFFKEHKALCITGIAVLCGAVALLVLKNNSVKNLFSKSIKQVQKENMPSNVLNKTTGKMETIIIDDIDEAILKKIKSGKCNLCEYTISAFAGDKEVGRMSLTTDGYRMYLPEGQKSLYIEYLATSPEYKGIGREMIKKAVKISNALGYGGHVDLLSAGGDLPDEYLRICGDKWKDYSAALAYRKMGFESASSMCRTERLDRYIREGKTGIIDGEDTLRTPMVLSTEAIKKYLE